MVKAFVSYVHEDKEKVDKLIEFLSNTGVDVWHDKKDLMPGQKWENAVRKGIIDGDFFIACFSSNYCRKRRSYMNEELMIAIEELRKRLYDSSWFIPLKLDNCEIPMRPIGAGETLHSLHWVALFEDWDQGIQAIAKIVNPNPEPYIHHLYQLNYTLLDESGRRTRIDSRSNLEVLKDEITLGGSGWTIKPHDLKVSHCKLNAQWEKCSPFKNVIVKRIRRTNEAYWWDTDFNPPLTRGQRIQIRNQFLIKSSFGKSHCSDSFHAFRKINKLIWTIKAPQNRPIQKCWGVCDFVQGVSDNQKLFESNTESTIASWSLANLHPGGIYYFHWVW